MQKIHEINGTQTAHTTDVNGIDKALINAQAYASEIIDLLEEARSAKTT